jgi:hypothetical protein
MNLKTIALTTAFALSSTFALAQAGGAGGAGAEVPETSGIATNAQGGVIGTTTNGVTTGTGMGSEAREMRRERAPNTAGSADRIGNTTSDQMTK